MFLLQILLHAQHVSNTIVPIIRSSKILYSWLLPVVFGALVFKLSVWCGAEGCVSGLSLTPLGMCNTKRRERPLLAKEETKPGILLAIRNLRKSLGSFTCRKARTWDRVLHAEDFYARKNPTASAGFEPANLGARGQHANH